MTSETQSREVWATFEALRASGPTKGPTMNSGVIYAVVGLVNFLGYAPREFEGVPTTDVVRSLFTTRDTLIRGWSDAESAGYLERESRKEPGQLRRGYIRFTDEFLALIDRIVEVGEQSNG